MVAGGVATNCTGSTNTMKKLLSIAAALALSFSLAAPASAWTYRERAANASASSDSGAQSVTAVGGASIGNGVAGGVATNQQFGVNEGYASSYADRNNANTQTGSFSETGGQSSYLGGSLGNAGQLGGALGASGAGGWTNGSASTFTQRCC